MQKRTKRRERWTVYEARKRELQRRRLSPVEYEEQLKALAKRMRL